MCDSDCLVVTYLAIYVDLLSCVVVSFFFFKQKTAYELRISDWSSDVCSSDLIGAQIEQIVDYDVLPRTEALDQMRRSVSGRIAAAGGVADSIEIEIGRASCRERVCQYV